MNSPIVSVILPVYNGENYLRLAIESVLRQTLQDYELIVVDDGSTDSTPQLTREYGNRIRYARQDNTGVAGAFNHGLRVATGRYISWLSHDDLFEPTKLEMQVKALSSYKTPAVCYTDACFIDPDGIVIKEIEIENPAPRELLRYLFVSRNISMSAYSLFYDRRCIDEIGMYDESQPVTQDTDMLIRLARRFPFVHVPQMLIRIRQHGERESLKKNWESEAFKFYRDWSDKLSLQELFPELGPEASATEKARARIWLGDHYADISMPPFNRLSKIQYRKAMRESPAIARSAMPRIVGLWWAGVRPHIPSERLSLGLGLGTAIRRLYGSKRRSE
jgi:glycosyltransferase involved in cell wall biosynthesis